MLKVQKFNLLKIEWFNLDFGHEQILLPSQKSLFSRAYSITFR